MEDFKSSFIFQLVPQVKPLEWFEIVSVIAETNDRIGLWGSILENGSVLVCMCVLDTSRSHLGKGSLS